MHARSIPIIRLRGCLIVSIQVELSDGLVLQLKDDLSTAIYGSDVEGLIIEVSGVDILDSFIASSIRDIASVARLMGVQTVLAGLDPGMAITLVEMGMTLEGVRTSLDLDAAFDYLMAERTDAAANTKELLEDILGGTLDASGGVP